MHTFYDRVTVEMRNILLPAFCLTGNDTCSSLYGHGKKTVITKDGYMFQDLKDLGKSHITKEKDKAVTKFIGVLYGKADCK